MEKIRLLKMACIVLAFCIATVIASPAQTTVSPNTTTFTDLLNFDGANGEAPIYVSPIQGSNGNGYATTFGGGTYDDGTIFEITSAGVLTTLYNFCVKTDCADGAAPYAGVVQASDGDLYGTTVAGGKYFNGTVFKITSANVLTTLHSFKGGPSEGAEPFSGLVLYSGDYYGTTAYGGTDGWGTVFGVTPGGVLTTLHSFAFTDGAYPYAGLVLAGGNFYGTTWEGGANYAGTIFEITPTGTLTTLYSFCSKTNCADGGYPYAGLVMADGNFYGTTADGGANYGGTVFEITPTGTLTTLYSFCSKTNCTDGSYPTAGLIQGTSGNLYGTTEVGGTYGYGTVFEITTGGTLTTLHSFDITKGAYPTGGLLQASNGDFYGTTSGGGTRLDGTVFSLSVGTESGPKK